MFKVGAIFICGPFFFGGGGGFHFFQCSTLPRKLMDKKCKRATVGSSQETGRFHEKLGDSRKNQESWRYMQNDNFNEHTLRPVLCLLYRATNPVPAVRIFHFQDGSDVTNPAGLSPCILPRKCKKWSNAPVPSQTLARKVGKSRAIPPYVPGVNPPGWPLISA